jgi:RimJ/RimL family protein N-acetyltransferase
LSLARQLLLRPAAHKDALLLWHWANDPVTRLMSFSNEPIGWDDHVRWLDRKLAEEGTWLFIAELDGHPVAQIRFETTGSPDAAEVSVGIDAEARSRGIGTEVIRSGTATVFDLTTIATVVARVRPQNVASIRAFTAAGYVVGAGSADFVTLRTSRAVETPDGG